MAINTLKFKNYQKQQGQAQTLAEQMAQEGEEESDWGQFLSIAAPLAASVLLPMAGPLVMGGLGGLAGGGGMLASLLGGAGAAGAGGTGLLGALAGTGTGALSTIGGGLATGLGKAAGTYAISEGIDTFGREALDKGGDVEDIGIGGGFRAREATEDARKGIQSTIDASDKGMKRSALLSGLVQGVDTMGGLDKIKELSADFGRHITGGGKGGAFNPAAEGLGMGKAAGDIGIGTPVQSIADTPLTEMPTPSFKPSLATEGASPLNFLTGDGAQTPNLLDNLPSYEGTSILDSLTQFTQEQSDYISNIIENNPNMTQEDLDALLATLGGQ